MGMITIKTQGSFPRTESVQFSAHISGHVMALNRAIQYLVKQVPAATKLDHKLQDEGSLPEQYFGYE